MSHAAWLATGDAPSTLAAADAACADAVRQVAAVPLLALLVFDCVGRRAVLGDASTFSILVNSIAIAVPRTLLALALATVFAWCIARTNTPGTRVP